MKKLYVFISALAFGAVSQAQETVDFESFSLTPDSYDNGSAGAGDFLMNTSYGDVRLSNFYDSQYFYFVGFSISNMTDNLTPGWLNQYSAYTGEGANSSDNYAVFYLNGSISLDFGNGGISSLSITNTTYAALSMMYGDDYGKQFGSPWNADSTVMDGTNGEDFYKVKLYGFDENDNFLDSMEFYLADYRFADPNDDYIVDTWENLDLSTIGYPSRVDFIVQSSDTTGGYMNTPAYFAVDNIVVGTNLGMEDKALSQVKIYPNPSNGMVSVQGAEGQLTVTSMDGQIVFEDDHSLQSILDLSHLAPGVYAIRLNNASGSYTNQLIIH